MGNDNNLKKGIDTQFRTGEEQARRARKGGKASGKARRERKQMRETLYTLLNLPLDKEKLTDLEDLKGFKELKGKNVTVQEAIIVAQVQRAMKGDLRAAEFIRDTVGEKPTERMNMNMNVPVLFEGEDSLED